MPVPDHTDDCIAGEHPDMECAAIEGRWNQPQGTYFSVAEEELGEPAPLCRINELAWEYQLADQDASA